VTYEKECDKSLAMNQVSYVLDLRDADLIWQQR
jgi:hypothetical protein